MKDAGNGQFSQSERKGQLMKSKLTVLSAAVTMAFGMALMSPATSVAAEDLDGQALFVETHKCNMCHTVPAAEIESKTKSEKMKGPDLGGKIEVPIEKLAAFMRNEAEIDGQKHKKPFKGTDEELQAIVDWLGSLEPVQ